MNWRFWLGVLADGASLFLLIIVMWALLVWLASYIPEGYMP